MASAENQVITEIIGDDSFKTFLLGHNITVGTIFSFVYTSKFSGLINIAGASVMVCVIVKWASGPVSCAGQWRTGVHSRGNSNYV